MYWNAEFRFRPNSRKSRTPGKAEPRRSPKSCRIFIGKKIRYLMCPNHTQSGSSFPGVRSFLVGAFTAVRHSENWALGKAEVQEKGQTPGKAGGPVNATKSWEKFQVRNVYYTLGLAIRASTKKNSLRPKPRFGTKILSRSDEGSKQCAKNFVDIFR